VTDHIIKSGVPTLVTSVTLVASTWVEHIKILHSDVTYDALVQTVEDPCIVAESKTVSGDLVFVNTFAYNAAGEVLRVPIVLHGDGTGTVKTAYFSGSTSHGKVIWTRGDE
jgi:hypothetical protein